MVYKLTKTAPPVEYRNGAPETADGLRSASSLQRRLDMHRRAEAWGAANGVRRVQVSFRNGEPTFSAAPFRIADARRELLLENARFANRNL
jgi:hypothetical protein